MRYLPELPSVNGTIATLISSGTWSVHCLMSTALFIIPSNFFGKTWGDIWKFSLFFIGKLFQDYSLSPVPAGIASKTRSMVALTAPHLSSYRPNAAWLVWFCSHGYPTKRMAWSTHIHLFPLTAYPAPGVVGLLERIPAIAGGGGVCQFIAKVRVEGAQQEWQDYILAEKQQKRRGIHLYRHTATG